MCVLYTSCSNSRYLDKLQRHYIHTMCKHARYVGFKFQSWEFAHAATMAKKTAKAKFSNTCLHPTIPSASNSYCLSTIHGVYGLIFDRWETTDRKNQPNKQDHPAKFITWTNSGTQYTTHSYFCRAQLRFNDPIAKWENPWAEGWTKNDNGCNPCLESEHDQIIIHDV